MNEQVIVKALEVALELTKLPSAENRNTGGGLRYSSVKDIHTQFHEYYAAIIKAINENPLHDPTAGAKPVVPIVQGSAKRE